MKFRKSMAVLLVLVAIVAIGVYLYRDSIARGVANAVLQDSGLAVTSLSIDSIGTNNIYFDELVLEQSSGTRIRVTGIALPIDSRRAQRREPHRGQCASLAAPQLIGSRSITNHRRADNDPDDGNGVRETPANGVAFVPQY